MPEVFKYGRWQPKSTERAVEDIRIGYVGVNAASSAYTLPELPEETLRRGKIILRWKAFKLLPKGKWLSFFYGWSNICFV
jgi:hypothetical protein